jgi:hypothetical protein
LANWRQQFQSQRELFERKARDFWQSAINSHRSDPSKLWDDINILLQPPVVARTLHTAMDHATFFRSKIERIRTSPAGASQPLLTKRSCIEVLSSSFSPVTEAEANKLLTSASAEHCCLDPAPTWLVKRFAVQLAPVIARLCNASFLSSCLLSTQKHANVSARLKKPTLNPDDLSSFRPISNLSFISKIIKCAIASRFTALCNQHNLLPSRQSAYRQHHSTETAVSIVHNDQWISDS